MNETTGGQKEQNLTDEQETTKFNGRTETAKFDGPSESSNLAKCDARIGDRMTHTANTVCPNRTHTNYMYINVILRRLGGLHINHQIYLNIYLQNGLFIVKRNSIHFFTLEFK